MAVHPSPLPTLPALPPCHPITPSAGGTEECMLNAPARVQALLCAYVGAQPEGSLSPEQLTQLAHAVRLAHLTPYFLAEVAPRVGWLCEGGREAAVHAARYERMGGPARRNNPAAWLPSAPARTGEVSPPNWTMQWEVPLTQLQPILDRVAAGGSSHETLISTSSLVVFGLDWVIALSATPVDDASTARPRAVQLGLHVVPRFSHVPTPPTSAAFRWVASWCYATGQRPIACMFKARN